MRSHPARRNRRAEPGKFPGKPVRSATATSQDSQALGSVQQNDLRGGDRSRFASCILRRGRCGGNSRHRLTRSLSWVNSSAFPPALRISRQLLGTSSRLFVIRLPSRSLSTRHSFTRRLVGEGWCFIIPSSFVIRQPRRSRAKAGAS